MISEKIKFKPNKLITFFSAIIIFLVCLELSDMGVFGEYTLFNGDLTSVTMPYYKCFTNIANNSSNYYYSFSYGFGDNISMLRAFVGMSPLALIYMLVKDVYIATVLIVGLKIAFSAVAFKYYCEKNLSQDGLISYFISLAYAFCGFQFYITNVSSLQDGLYLIPLAFVAIKRGIKTGKFEFVTIIYAFSFIIQFYCGYLIGLASFAFFVTYLVIYRSEFELKEIKIKVLRYILSVITAIFISAFITIPAAIRSIEMMGDDSSTFIFTPISILDIISSLCYGSKIVFSEPFPYIYVGTIVAICLPLYFLNKSISKKEKIVADIFMATYVISFVIKPLYLLLHLFNEPDGYTARFSLIMVFALATISVKILSFKESINKKSVYIVGSFIGLIYICTPFIEKLLGQQFIISSDVYSKILSVGLILLLCIIICYEFKSPNKWYFAIGIIVLLEVILNTINIFQGIKESAYTRDEYDYYSSLESEFSEAIKNEDKSDFYRVNYMDSYTLNPSMIYGLPTTTAFGSTYNNNLYKTLYKLGIGVHDFYLTVYGNNDVTDMLLGTKYNVDLNYPDGIDAPALYVNPRDLSLGYMVDKDVLNIELSNNPFVNLNSVITNITGSELEVFEPFEGYLAIESTGAYIEADTENGGLNVFRENISENEWVSITIDDDSDRRAFAYFGCDDNRAYGSSPVLYSADDIYMTRPLLSYLSTPHIVEMENYGEGNAITIIFYPNTDVSWHIDNYSFYYLNEDALNKAYDCLSDEQLKVDTYENGYVAGTIDVKKSGIMFLSISYDKNWEIYVDGELSNVVPLLDNSFCGVELSEGVHNIEMIYKAKGARVGIILSIIGLFLGVISTIYSIKSNKY